MKQNSLQTFMSCLLTGAFLLFTAGCIRVPAGPHAKVYIQCSTEVSNTLNPAMQCYTIAASKVNKCDIKFSIVCSDRTEATATLQPGQQGTLCCPEGAVASTVKVVCEKGDGQCRYYIVNHAAGAKTEKKCFR